MLKKMNENELREFLDGKEIDFYLEDDMFELEGNVEDQDGKIIVNVISAVSHMMEISGDSLEVKPKHKKLYAERTDKSRTFEMEINRVYKRLKDPDANRFLMMKEKGLFQFFKKLTDTLVWYEKSENKWFIELNKINMYFSGDRKSYASIQELCEKNKQHLLGEWQIIYFSSEVEEE